MRMQNCPSKEDAQKVDACLNDYPPYVAEAVWDVLPRVYENPVALVEHLDGRFGSVTLDDVGVTIIVAFDEPGEVEEAIRFVELVKTPNRFSPQPLEFVFAV